MLAFESDYNHGAHPQILQRMMETNKEAYPGYGTDEVCESAKKKIRAKINKPEAEIYFGVGGTQVNQLVIDTVLAPYEGVVAATTGHVSAHEAGAIEFSGHKVLTVPGYDGKIRAKDVQQLIDTFYGDANHEHMVFPGMVYLSFPTEYGTIYSKKELEEIHKVCKEFHIPLFIDGARLGYGLMSKASDITLEELADLCEVFYIGGTKVGALFGEAVVFSNMQAPPHFVAQIKQHGALLAKGWLLGLQYDVLFEDDLYLTISRNAIDMAEKLKKVLLEKGYRLFLDTPTNQIFVVLENGKMEELRSAVRFGFWEKYDDNHTVVRFATSWATTEEEIEALAAVL